MSVSLSLCSVCVVWSFVRLPGPKDRTYGELDILFEREISARKFSKTVVDPFHGENPAAHKVEKEAETMAM